MLNDPLANVLSYINNHEKLGRKEILVGNNSKFIRQVLDILKENNYIGEYKEIEDGKVTFPFLMGTFKRYLSTDLLKKEDSALLSELLRRL